MITGKLKTKIDNLWKIFWTGGISNPLEVIEQMTYLMFIHDLEDAYAPIFDGNVSIGNQQTDGKLLRWSVFKQFDAPRMYETVQGRVFPFIKSLHGYKNSVYTQYMGDAIFKIPTPHMLKEIVTAMDDIYEQMAQLKDADTRGDVYEYMLSKLATAGVNGQFRTPRHIIRMMVELIQPTPADTICDPACGTSGFLVEAGEFLKERYKQNICNGNTGKEHIMAHMFHGYDIDRTMLRIGAMNMMAHGIKNPDIRYRDSLSPQNEDTDCYTLILANPPFKGTLNTDAVHCGLKKACKTKKRELLFLALFLRMLKVGGHCACIVPEGVLFGSSHAHKGIRKTLILEQKLQAVISMPGGVFKPYAGVSTAILIFTKTNHGGTDKVWFYDMKADGFSMDDKRTPTEANDIADIIHRFRNLSAEASRQRTEQSFLVPKQEIIDNDYDLSFNKYKQTVPTPVAYPPAADILAVIHQLQTEIDNNLSELEKLLNLNNKQ